MGMCKGCNLVFNINEMKLGYCISCQSKGLLENKINEDKIKELAQDIIAAQKEENTKNKAKAQLNFIKTYYRHMYFGIIFLVVLFPPHYTKHGWIKYKFIVGSNLPIHFGTFIAELIGFIFITAAFYFLFIKKRPCN
jgi:hypothetical protein